MKMRTSKVIVLGEPDGFAAAIVLPPPTMKGEPKRVAATFQADGERVEVMLSGDEARAYGELLMVSGAVASGGMPPVVEGIPENKPAVLA